MSLDLCYSPAMHCVNIRIVILPVDCQRRLAPISVPSVDVLPIPNLAIHRRTVCLHHAVQWCTTGRNVRKTRRAAMPCRQMTYVNFRCCRVAPQSAPFPFLGRPQNLRVEIRPDRRCSARSSQAWGGKRVIAIPSHISVINLSVKTGAAGDR